MYGLSLEWERCPDGVEAVDLSEPVGGTIAYSPELLGIWARCRSDRRDVVRYDISNLEDPIVLHFVNARDDEARLRFLSRFGLLGPWTERGRTTQLPLDMVSENQKVLEALLWKAGSGKPVEAMTSVNSLLASHKGFALVPVLDLAGGSNVPRLALHPQSLLGLMAMEVAMVAANDARTTTCQNCGKVFVTGPLTGRRAHALYCSDRCRVAAMRKRNSEKN